MKNTGLVFTSSIIITNIIIILIINVDIQFYYNFRNLFWSNGWMLNILGWICLIIACATIALMIYFAYKKNKVVSYGLGVVAGIFAGILLYMITMRAIYLAP